MTEVAAPPRPQAAAADLDLFDLHDALAAPVFDSMTFLNEVAQRYPNAISFAAGRSNEDFLEVEAVHRYLRKFTDYLMAAHGGSRHAVRRTLLQYGRTKGIIHELVARNLAVDEGIEVDPESVVVTVGCQEAMYLVLRALRRGPDDALLAVLPCYVGVTGAAHLVDMPIVPVAGSPTGIDLDDLEQAIDRARRAGLRPRACYVVADHANPSGVSMDLDSRRRLLDLAARHDLLVLEDNPYGLFHGDSAPLPTLKSMDRDRRVVYLGTFAKTAMPGARVGYVVADQVVSGGPDGPELLADQLAKLKSMLTVNTSPIAQAVIGGKLLENGYSLRVATARERRFYQNNLRTLLDGLARWFPSGPDQRVTWNTPSGGFFVVLDVPFEASDALLRHSANRYGVVWTPMHHFYGDGRARRQIRLSFSYLTPEEIEVGLDRLAAFIAEQDAP